MELVPIWKLNISEKFCNYLPHHAVFKETSTTTKTRVVFDGSACDSDGESLNSRLVVGRKLQQNLCTILMRWRFHIVALSGDIEKMYRQIAQHPKDRDYHIIIWREFMKDKVQTYRMTRVTFGIGSCSHMSIRSLQEAIIHAKDDETIAAILDDFYVDDLLTGAKNEEDAWALMQSIIEALAKACFPLRKIEPSCTLLVQRLPEAERENATAFEDQKTT
jgi:hypothetical protein